MATAITAGTVKELRERTGAGMMECKKALEETNGDIEAAIDVLRSKGAAKAAKRAGKETTEGAVGSYIHMGGKIGVLIEVGCETDFVARTEAFQALVRDLAMHIAASNPLGVSEAEVPAEVIERERSVYLETVKQEGKPEAMHEKIVEGKIKRFFKDVTLMAQPFVKNPDQTVEQMITEVSAKTGERIVVRRFVRYELGA